MSGSEANAISDGSIVTVTSWVPARGLAWLAESAVDVAFTASARIVADASDGGRQFIHVDAHNDHNEVLLSPEAALDFAQRLTQLARYALDHNRNELRQSA